MITKSTTKYVGLLSVNNKRLAYSMFEWQGLIQTHFHESVEAQSVMFFLYIASQTNPEDMTSVGKTLKLSKAATSRNYYRLSIGIRGGAIGLGLVTIQNDLLDIRRKLLVLTDKGMQVASELMEFIFKSTENINVHDGKE